ncbi:MAG TPA: DinB family protein [Phytomonospora sp.]
MTEFQEQDLTGACFANVNLRDASFTRVRLNGAEMREVDFGDVRIHGALFSGTRLRGVYLHGVEISGELSGVVVNGVDIAPLVEAELDRRHPDRVLMRPEDADGFRAGWAALDRLWEGTIARARTFPEGSLHERADGEWSFIETLRHLNFAYACWVDRMLLGVDAPWHPLDLPWEEAPGWPGVVPWDREARPSLDEVLAVRAERTATIGRVLAALTDELLATEVARTSPGYPQEEGMPYRECLRVVLNEGWEHRLYAERDLTVLEG